MDTSAPSLFERLQQRLASAFEPLQALYQFQTELMHSFPTAANTVVELVASWGHRLEIPTRADSKASSSEMERYNKPCSAPN
ncbi:hypothetical protein XaCFBP7622_01545 [Xanthomonas arboricola]|nr:hypothetical protein XaCFBP7622_01545 [Xanthomonas arboricola]